MRALGIATTAGTTLTPISLLPDVDGEPADGEVRAGVDDRRVRAYHAIRASQRGDGADVAGDCVEGPNSRRREHCCLQ